MKRFVTTILAAVAVAACFDDPTSDLRGGPAAIRLNASTLFLEPAESVGVFANLVDAQGNQVPGAVTFASVDVAIATAGDVGATIPGDVEHSGWVKAGASGGATYVRATGGGITDSIYVVVVPDAVAATFSPSPTTMGTPVTVTSTSSLVTVDPANATVSIDGAPVEVLSATSTSVTFLPFATAGGTVEVGGLILLGSIGLPPLPATTTVVVADPDEPGNDAPAGGAAIAAPVNVGDTVTVYGSIDGSNIDDFFTLQMTTGDSVLIEVEWFNEDVDIDAFLLNAAGGGFCVLDDGCSAATSADPEVIEARLAAATNYEILVELWDAHGVPMPMLYVIRVIRLA